MRYKFGFYTDEMIDHWTPPAVRLPAKNTRVMVTLVRDSDKKRIVTGAYHNRVNWVTDVPGVVKAWADKAPAYRGDIGGLVE